MNKQQLAAKIWESANRMRSKIEANEYKDYILGFIFYKYLSDKEEEWLRARDYDPDSIRQYVNEETDDSISGKSSAQRDLGYFIAYKDLFSTWIHMGPDFSVDNVRTALSSFSRLISPSHKKVFDGIFNTLETGLSKLGDNTRSQTKAISDLIQLINEIPMTGKQDYDVLGFIYEYLISNFAANAGKKAGEFYTPHEVSQVMSEIVADHLKDHDTIRIYDPTSGSGSLLITIGQAVSRYIGDPNKIRYYAQELKSNTYNLTRMNLVMRGILPSNIVTRNGDTLEEDWPYFDDADPAGTYEPLYVDAVVSNPPYSQRWDPSGKENDPRYSRYGLAPKSKADYAFLLHDLYHLKPDGIMTIVLPHGVLFRGGEEGQIRRNLIEQNNIDAIIGLPANIFFGTGIPTIIMVLRQKRENTDVLIVDASKGFAKEGKNNRLRACDIRKIVDTVTGRLDVPKYSRKVSKEEIRQNDYNLNIPRYVDSSESAESWDIYASMFGGIPEKELDELEEYWKVFPSLKDELFEGENGYYHLREAAPGTARNDTGSEDSAAAGQTDEAAASGTDLTSAASLKKVILQNADVSSFLQRYTDTFADFRSQLDAVLIDQAETLPIVRTEDEITADIFRRFADIPLIDRYTAYELFHSAYNEISGDLELIQMEGLQAVRTVDPNMVLKKKNGKDAEVQEGWKGHILPFDLVQKVLLKEDLAAIEEKNDRLQSIPSDEDSLLEDLSEDDKEAAGDALTEEGDAFVPKNVSAVIKMLKKDDAASNAALIRTLTKVQNLSEEEKQLKTEMKADQDALELKTKDTIEHLSDDQVRQLLDARWISPVTEGIAALPDHLLEDLAKKIEALSKKYANTYEDIEDEIRDTERSLSAQLSELTGSAADMAGIRELQKLLG